MPFEVRASTAEEREIVLEVTDAAFKDTPRDYFDNAWKHDAEHAPELLRVGVLDGRIVSSVRICKRLMRVGCAKVLLGGIGDVATHPEFRGRGYSTLVLEDCVRYMQENDYHLSMLFTGIHGFYRRLGWEQFPTCNHTFVLTPALPEAPGHDYEISEFDKSKHLASVANVHAAYNNLRTGTMKRDDRYWAGLFWRHYDPRGFLVATQGSKVVAYLRGVQGETARVVEFGYWANHATAFRALLHRFLTAAKESGSAQFTATVPQDEVALRAFHEYAERVTVNQGMSMMLRIINVRRFLEAIVPELERRAIATKVAPFALSLRSMGETLEVRWTGEHVVIDEPHDALLTLGLHPIWLQHLLLGAGLPALRALPLTEAEQKGLEAIAGTGEFVLWGVDGF